MRRLSRCVTPRFFYHITDQPWDDIVTLHPRVDGYYRGEDEPEVARICVAPSLFHCVLAIPYNRHKKEPYKLYVTAEKVRPYKPYGIYDARKTHEKWIREECVFRFVKYVDITTTFPHPPCFLETTYTKKYIERYNQLREILQ